MINLKVYFERTGLGACLICECIECYEVSYEELKVIKGLGELLKNVATLIQFRGGTFEVSGMKFIAFRLKNCLLISPVKENLGTTYYTVEKILGEFGWLDT
jgi:hypothetical protein